MFIKHVPIVPMNVRKLPPNMSGVPINDVSFHSRESVHKWKYMVQRHIADELNMFDKHQPCTPVIK